MSAVFAKKEDYRVINPGMFNLAKGYGFILVVAWHMGVKFFDVYPEGLDHSLEFVLSVLGYAILPMFLVVAGYSYRPSDLKKSFKKEADLLLKPYLITELLAAAAAVLYQAVRALAHGNFSGPDFSLSNIFLSNLLSRLFVMCGNMLYSGTRIAGKYDIVGIGAIWYLPMQFLSWFLVDLAVTRLGEKKAAIPVIVLSLIGCLSRHMIALPFALQQGMVGAAYYYLGWQVKQKKLLSRHGNSKWWIAVIICGTVGALIGQVNMYSMTIRYGVADLIFAGISALGIAYIGWLLTRYRFPLEQTVSDIGLNTFYMLCIHSVEDVAVPWGGLIKCFGTHRLAAFLILLLVRLALNVLICQLILRCKKALARRKTHTAAAE